MPVSEMGTLDQWILAHAKAVFDEVEGYFKEYEFSKGFALLNHFIAVELSGIYLDISKDRLYCNAKNDSIRLSAQSAMALIAEKLMALMAPTLTYTIDEMLEYAPAILKKESVFDLVYTSLPNVPTSFDEAYMVEAREKFFEIVDALKKEKIIKSTLELVLQTNSPKVAALEKVDAEDWFTVSKVIEHDESGEMGVFEVGDDRFKILKASKCKCPRCWKYRSKSEEELCHRCNEALNG
jgi:isoleucyl-tRNA synthetase